MALVIKLSTQFQRRRGGSICELLSCAEPACCADSGLARAQYSLGVFYDRGEYVPKSTTDATVWFAKAAAQGWRDAQVSLATQYFLGRGAPKDFKEAHKWYEKAAALGFGAVGWCSKALGSEYQDMALTEERCSSW